jgi:hypothetical protein
MCPLPYSAPGLGIADLTFRANLINSNTGSNLAVPLELRESAAVGITGQVASVYVPLTVGR